MKSKTGEKSTQGESKEVTEDDAEAMDLTEGAPEKTAYERMMIIKFAAAYRRFYGAEVDLHCET